MTEVTFLVYVLILFVIIYVSQSLWRSSTYNAKYKLPPLVPGLPIFGNTFQIPLSQQGPWAKKLAEKYGEMWVSLKYHPTNLQHLLTESSSKVYLQVWWQHLGFFKLVPGCDGPDGASSCTLLF